MPETRLAAAMERAARNAPYLLLVGALAASAALTLALTAPLTFFGDTWSVLMNRRELTLETILAPHNEHIIALPVLLQNLFLAVFGMVSARPEQVALTLCLLGVACLLFVYARRRVGAWPALFAASLLLFLGPAWEAILWPFEIGFAASVFFGIATLLALDRDDRRGDVAASAFLTLAILCSSLGTPFVVAVAVDLLLKRRRRGLLPRLFVLAVPMVVFLAWYAGWGSEASTNISVRNILASPSFVFEMVAFAAAGTVGLGTAPYEVIGSRIWGYALAIALAAGLGFMVARRRLPVTFWPVAAAAATSWFLTAFNQVPGREPLTSRYVYASAFFLLLMTANALRGTRFAPRVLVAMGALTLAAISLNATTLERGRDWLRQQTVLTRADLAAIEIARTSVSPTFQLTPEFAGTRTLVNVTAGEYLEAVEEHGSPAYSEEELLDAPERARRQADIVLSGALPLSTQTRAGAGPIEGEGCRNAATADPSTGIRLASEVTRIEIASGPDATLGLRRFTTEDFPVPTRPLSGGTTILLTIPRDASSLPWYLEVRARQPVAVCAAAAS